MAKILYNNNAYSTLNGAITNVATTLIVQTGHGDRFPAVSGTDIAYITLEDASGNREIVKVTARTAASDTMTIVRAQEGTSARAWASGDVVEQRITAGELARYEMLSNVEDSASKTTPADADMIPLKDSAASNILKQLTWTNLKATLKTYFDTVYAAIGAVTGSGLTMATGKLLGRSTASTGAIEEITVGTGLTLSAGSLSASGGITLATLQNSTSGTSIDFTGIPSGTKQITVMFNLVSTSGTSGSMIQIGDSGGVENTGYTSVRSFDDSGASLNIAGGGTTGWDTSDPGSAANQRTGVFHLYLMDSSTNTWQITYRIAFMNTANRICAGVGTKALSATLDRVRITSVTPDSFDLGKVNIQYA